MYMKTAHPIVTVHANIDKEVIPQILRPELIARILSVACSFQIYYNIHTFTAIHIIATV